MASGQKTEFTINARDKTKRGLTSAQKNLKKTSKEADTLAKRFRNVARATVIMEGPLGGTAGRLSAMATMLNSVNAGTIAFGIGVTAMTAVTLKSLKAFSEWESQMFKINALLETTGTASGLTAKEIEDMSLRIARATLASASEVRDSAALLLTFRTVSVDSFEAVLDIAQDLVALTGNQMKQNLIQVAKAMEDPATGLTALRRSGVSFTNSQKDMIVQMHATGNVMGAQAEVMALLRGQLEGGGKAAAGGLAGAIDLVSDNWTEMLKQMSTSGAGEVVTDMINALGNWLESVGDWFDPSGADGLLAVNEDIARNQKELIRLKEEDSWLDRGRIRLLEREYRALLDKREVIQEGLFWAKEDVRLARIKGVETQKQMALTKSLARIESDRIEKADAAKKQLDKETKTAGGFAQKLIAEEDRFQTSLLTKSEQEDIFYADRLIKLQAFHEAGALSEELANEAGLAARQLYEGRISAIKIAEGERRADDEKKFAANQLAASTGALGDLSTLMSSHSKKAFNVGKGAAISQAVVKGFSAAISAWDAGMSTGGPWAPAIAAAYTAASIAKTAVQIQQLKSTKFSGAKQFGGSVIGGRAYLVGERGPELFTPPRSGNIINNKTLNSSGGNANTINVTNILDRGEEYIDKNMEKIWNGMLDKMNENGVGFA